MNDKRTRPLQLDEPIITGNAKAAGKEAGATSGDLWKVPYDQIHYDRRDNVRPLDPPWAKHIGKLIAANGYDWSQPLHCYIRKIDGRNLYYVSKGQHRYHGIGHAIAAGANVGLLHAAITPKGLFLPVAALVGMALVTALYPAISAARVQPAVGMRDL